MSLVALNTMSVDAARDALSQCCVSRGWIAGMLERRPFRDAVELRDAARASWECLGEADWLEAFEGHPKIGDVSSLRTKYAASARLAAQEQASVADATEDVLQRLARGNREYESRFGFIFIVCATGKTAAEMCELLEQRLRSEREAELRTAAGEQFRILMLRLEELL
ncbi:MAG: 2-oxo-4-hydroxy-4-carboxy-5-ureidoimidazoline decarboxylase [Halieaceae bacterium]|nr:2-oxo-4-hydroxy-4-carboxy-5-ureidoimidazoline decarboxylase [Halieaceae bacterium]